MFRRVLLLLAPVPIISGSMTLSMWAHSGRDAVTARNVCFRSDSAAASHFAGDPRHAAAEVPSAEMARSCEVLARRQVRRLHGPAEVIVRAPLVVCGDISRLELDALYRETMLPAMESMLRDYFISAPHKPIVVLVFSNESTYRDHALTLFGQTSVPIYGYYKPSTRTVVVNLEAGRGTLCHELTHALMDFDFTAAPMWLNEGLASLHEHCEIVKDEAGSRIAPLLNWRLPILQEAIRTRTLRPTSPFLLTRRLQGSEEALNYAHARYFCFFLHERGVLADTYTRLRSGWEDDPLGTHTLLESFPGQSWPEVEAEFRRWVMQLPAAT